MLPLSILTVLQYIQPYQFPKNLEILYSQLLTQLRLTLSELKIIIMGEISMVADTTLLHIHQRLKEIFNIPNSELFACISFIAVDDPYHIFQVHETIA